MGIEYLATEFIDDPPRPIARWYSVEAGTYARYAQESIDFFTSAELKAEQSIGTTVQFVARDGDPVEVEEIGIAWTDHAGRLLSDA